MADKAINRGKKKGDKKIQDGASLATRAEANPEPINIDRLDSLGQHSLTQSTCEVIGDEQESSPDALILVCAIEHSETTMTSSSSVTGASYGNAWIALEWIQGTTT